MGGGRNQPCNECDEQAGEVSTKPSSFMQMRGSTALLADHLLRAGVSGGQEDTMATPVSVTKLEVKSHETPDEVRTPARSRVEVVRFDGFTLGRFRFERGWRWSECIKPVVKTDSCQNSHVGYVVSGRITVRMQDGKTQTLKAGQSYTIPPGHDAWVEGDEPFVGIEVLSAEQYAKPK
jgi:hypothetical protein